MQDIGRAGQEEPQTVGEERRRRRAVAMEIAFHGLDIILAIAAGAVEVLILKRRTKSSSKLLSYEETRYCRLNATPEPIFSGVTNRSSLCCIATLDLASWLPSPNVLDPRKALSARLQMTSFAWRAGHLAP
jgi:hypothetical protein